MCAIQQKITHVGLSAPHDGAELKNADSEAPGSTHERRQGRRFGAGFKWLRRRHQNQLVVNSSSSFPFEKGSGLMSTQWMWVSETSTSSSIFETPENVSDFTQPAFTGTRRPSWATRRLARDPRGRSATRQGTSTRGERRGR